MSLHSFLCRSVPILLYRPCSNFLHRGSISPKNFEGHLACGASCYMLHHYLNAKYNIKTKMMHKKLGSNDHCYLISDKTIFDPTYRQFLPRNHWFDSFLYVGALDQLETHVGRPYWSNAVESNEKMDAGEVLADLNYSIQRGSCFYRLYQEFCRDELENIEYVENNLHLQNFFIENQQSIKRNVADLDRYKNRRK